MADTLITYGGGEILKNVFEGVAMLMNNKSGDLFRPLMVTAASLGALLAVVKALFAPSIEGFLGRYFFPLIAIVSVMMVPSKSVRIEDVLTNRSYKVGHVPLLLAKSSQVISTIGYQLTRGVEKVMHTPSDTNYITTGMIFGSDTSMEMSQYRLTNADLESNMRRFCKQCVLYDLALGKYSIDDLKKSTDLWAFFRENTSKVRMISYCPPNSKTPGKCSYVSCQDAIKEMTPLFEKEKAYYSKHEMLKDLPISFQALTGLQQNAQTIIGQQLVMNTVRDEYSADGFAKSRSQMQQRSTYRALGSIASSSLVTMRAVIEALVYASFIFVMPMAMVPGGFRFITKWLGLLIWIQMWPPFFAILSYVMQTVAQTQSASIFTGLTEAQRGLSLFTSIGLTNLQEDIFALAGYLSASIPFISYALLQGGVGSFMHLAGSMMTPAHSAAATAAGEQATGNYSFSSVSMGQSHYGNESVLQKNLSPSLSTGSFTEDRGSSRIRHASDGALIAQQTSDFRTNINGDEVLTESLNRSRSEVESYVHSENEAFSKTISVSARSASDISESIANSQNLSESTTLREDGSEMTSARHFRTMSDDWGKQFGLSSRASGEIMAAASIAVKGGTPLCDILNLGATLSAETRAAVSHSNNREEVLTSAMRHAEGQEVQESFQSLVNYARNETANSSDDSLKRASLTLVNAVDEAQQHNTNTQKALSYSDAIQEQIALVKTQSASIRHNFGQDLLDYGVTTYFEGAAGIEDVNRVMALPSSNPEKAEFISSFLDFKRSELNAKSLASYEAANWFNTERERLTQDFSNNQTKRVDYEHETEQVYENYADYVQKNLVVPEDLSQRTGTLQGQVGVELEHVRTVQKERDGRIPSVEFTDFRKTRPAHVSELQEININNKRPGLMSTKDN